MITMNPSTIDDKEIVFTCAQCGILSKKLESEGVSICYECYKKENV